MSAQARQVSLAPTNPRYLAFFGLVLAVTVSVHFRYSPYLFSHALRFAAAAAALAAAIPLARSELLARAVRRAWAALRAGGDWSVALLCLAAFGLSLAVCYGILDPVPHVPDEFAYLFQAHTFASGSLFRAAPAIGEFLPADWIAQHDGRWFAIFPPGWPALLALGVWLGAPALVNPSLGALSLLAIHRLARHCLGEERALAVALLCLVSPFFVFMCASFMSHPASLLFATVSLLYLLRATESGSLARFAASGIFAGLGVLVRPLDAVILWLAAVCCLALGQRSARQGLGTLVSGAGVAAGAALYLAYNHALMGDWLASPLALTSPQNRLGFGPDVGLAWSGFPTPGHTPWRGLLNLDYNAAVLSADLFGWPISSLWPIAALVCFGRLTAVHRLCFAAMGAIAIAYLGYWYHGVCFGARFYFALLPMLLILTVEGLALAPRAAAAASSALRAHANALTPLVGAFVALCFVYSATVYVPVMSLFAPYRNHRNIGPGLAEFVRAEGITAGLVFVEGDVHAFAPGFIANALDPAQGAILYARESGARDELLIQQLPDRKVFRYRAPGPRHDDYPPWVSEIVFGNWLQPQVLAARDVPSPSGADVGVSRR